MQAKDGEKYWVTKKCFKSFLFVANVCGWATQILLLDVNISVWIYQSSWCNRSLTSQLKYLDQLSLIISDMVDQDAAIWDPTREIWIIDSPTHNDYIMIKAAARQHNYPSSTAAPPTTKSGLKTVRRVCPALSHNLVLCFVCEGSVLKNRSTLGLRITLTVYSCLAKVL